MIKIRVVENKIIPFDNENVIINNESITFINNGNYSIDYINCYDISFNIVIEKNVCINLFEYSNNNNFSSNNSYFLDSNSSIIVNKFYYNDNCNENINIYLNGEKSNIKYNFSCISENNNKFIINIYHKNNSTSSDIFNRTVSKEKSSNVFDINSYVNNGIKNCYINQQTKIITLGDSNNKINPNMYIGEESTTAVHSSVVGRINDDELFYLMSRGIDYKTSLNLIIKGIILSNINADMEYMERILKILDRFGGE